MGLQREILVQLLVSLHQCVPERESSESFLAVLLRVVSEWKYELSVMGDTVCTQLAWWGVGYGATVLMVGSVNWDGVG